MFGGVAGRARCCRTAGFAAVDEAAAGLALRACVGVAHFADANGSR